jgi:hypothetical protein
MGRFDIRTRTGLIYPIIQGLSAVSYDDDAQAFFNRVTAAGGTLTSTEKDAVNQLVLDLKANSIWTSMLAIYPMVGASAASCAQNLVSSSYTGTFSGGWTFVSTGITGNGTNTFMNTGLVPSAVVNQNSNHLSFYSRSNVAASNMVALGSYSISTISYFHMHPYYTGNIIYNLLTSNTAVGPTNTNSLGFFNGNRTSATNISNFKNGTNLGNVTSPSVSVSPNTYNVYVGALNEVGSAILYNNYQCAFASIGAGLSDTQASNFYTNVQTFQTSLSRNV